MKQSKRWRISEPLLREQIEETISELTKVLH